MLDVVDITAVLRFQKWRVVDGQPLGSFEQPSYLFILIKVLLVLIFSRSHLLTARVFAAFDYVLLLGNLLAVSFLNLGGRDLLNSDLRRARNSSCFFVCLLFPTAPCWCWYAILSWWSTPLFGISNLFLILNLNLYTKLLLLLGFVDFCTFCLRTICWLLDIGTFFFINLLLCLSFSCGGCSYALLLLSACYRVSDCAFERLI